MGTTRVDEMALTIDGELLLAANNAEDPPFAALFRANGDEHVSSPAILSKITIDAAIVPAGAGLSMEQPAWDPRPGASRRHHLRRWPFGGRPEGGHDVQLRDRRVQSGDQHGVVPLHACGPNARR